MQKGMVVKVKKLKFTAILIVMLTAIFNIRTYAATKYLTVEGEDYTSADFSVPLYSSKDFSNSKFVDIRYNIESKPIHNISYEFDVQKAGYYGLEVVASILKAGYTTDYNILINDEIYIDTAAAAVKLNDYTTEVYNKVIKRYYMGNYYFKKGINKLTFQINDADRADTTNFVTTFIDCFDLTVEDFEIGSIVTPESCNIYEDGKDIEFNMTFKGLCPEEMTYNYEVVDIWGSTVAKGKLICRQGTGTKAFRVNKLPTGWYKLKVTDENGEKAFRDVSVAVVPKLSERIQGESPFAMDFAGTDVVANVNTVAKLSNAARYAGVQWIRERFQWTRMQPAAKKDYRFNVTDEFIDVIRAEGLKISDIFYGNPTWRKDTDLFDLYYAVKAAAEHYKDDVHAWELYNEVDGNFQKWSGDVYASIMKAMAIGVKDSGSDAQVSVQGMCRFVEGDRFIDLQTRNNVMDYSDIYNLHFHITENSDLNQDIMLSHFKTHRELKFHTGAEAKPFWITESGIYQNQKNGELSEDQRQKTARYLVTSTTQSLSTGTTKHFWFLLAPYVEAGIKEMGIFDKYCEPSPAYVAEAVMTNVLGHGKYKGQIEMADAEGHVFDSGRGDVLTIWTDEPRNIELNSDKAVTVTNIMGYKETVEPVNGKVKVSISHYPVYVSYNTTMPEEDYYPMSYKGDESLRINLTEAERVVLLQDFPATPQELAKGGGYKFKFGKDMNMQVKLYNFNDKTMRGTLHAELDGYEIVMDRNVIIPAMSEITVPVVIKEKEKPVYGVGKYLKFYAEFDGQQTSPSISYTILQDNEPEDPDFVNEAALEPSNWDVTNISAGASATATVDPKDPKVMNFSLKYNGGDKWFYPYLNLGIDPKELAEYDGFMYWMRVTSEEDVFKGIPNMFAYLSDGRSYYIGQETGIPQEMEWVKVKKYWKDMILFSSPLGKEYDLRPFDPTLITKIGIGTNPTKNELNYQIKGVGYFKDDDEEQIKEETIDFVSPDLETVRDRKELSNVVISLPTGEYKKVTIMLGDDIYENFKVEDNKVYVDLSAVQRGKYALRIITEDKNGYISSEEADITLD